MEEALKKSLDKAKILMLSTGSSVFLSTILYSLKIKWDESLNPPTAGVDGITLSIHPKFWLSLSINEQLFLLAHEAWHVAFGHVTPPENIDNNRYNKAADYVINIMLKDMPYANNTIKYSMPDGGLCDEKYRNMSTMEVYKLLDESNQEEDNTGIGNDLKEPTKDVSKTDQINNIKDILTKAKKAEEMYGDKGCGNIPEEITIAIDKLTDPKLPWEIILQNFISTFSKSDYSYKKLNRRYLPDVFLPTLYSEGMGSIIIARDTSGSVYEEELSQFMSESQYIKEQLNPDIMKIVDFDTNIRNEFVFYKDEDLPNLTCTGRGGTDLQCVFKHFEKQPPELLVIFSDLWCDVIENDPGYPVIWVCINNKNAEVNFGKLIHLET